MFYRVHAALLTENSIVTHQLHGRRRCGLPGHRVLAVAPVGISTRRAAVIGALFQPVGSGSPRPLLVPPGRVCLSV